jgi:hypothetical protein
MSRLAAYGPTASDAMTRTHGGNAYSLPSREERQSMESMDNSLLRFAGGGKTYDHGSGQYLPDITPRQSFRSMYDLTAPRTIESIQNSYPTGRFTSAHLELQSSRLVNVTNFVGFVFFLVEIMDFPDVFDLPDIAEVWISRLEARELWPFRVMPMSLTDRLDYSFTELVRTLSGHMLSDVFLAFRASYSPVDVVSLLTGLQ